MSHGERSQHAPPNERRAPRQKRTWGADVEGHGTRFRLWAPKRKRVSVVLDGTRTVPLRREPSGWFIEHVDDCRAGTRYGFRLDDDPRVLPDPASRYQPDGPHGLSQVVDPSTFRWTDEAWRGVSMRGQVVYEMHVGTFTREGTWAAAMRELPYLRDLGITLIEMMPVNEFPGRFGWGYDGVDLYAPTHLYGTPDDLRAFVDRAHAVGLGVVLDVVYNHLGPSGNYLRELADGFFTDRYENEWGDAIDFETEPAARAYFAENGAYWVDELHFDGLRLDATQCIFDASETHVVKEIAELARAAARHRSIVLIAENEPQHAALARPTAEGGFGLDAIWNDDFHHSARIAATGRAEAYYSSACGKAQELVSAVKWGTLFQGQLYPWQEKRRGTPAFDLPAEAFVAYLQNHDQVANSGRGLRLSALASPGRVRALTALLLLAPSTPMLFQGQEIAATAPFLFFADHEPELAELVAKGRRGFLDQFPSLQDPKTKELTALPHDAQTFERCKLDLSERFRPGHAETFALHKELLRLRREDPTFSAQRRDLVHGAVLATEAFVVRFGTGTGEDRLLLVNLGCDLDLVSVAEPLLAPLHGYDWRVLVSTEDPRYGGSGTPPAREHGQRVLLGHSALVLAPEPLDDEARRTLAKKGEP